MSGRGPHLAVVIPVRNEAQRLPLLLADLAQAPAGLVAERLVVDGGSHDGSGSVARLAGATVLHGPANRGRQLQLGVAASTAPWLLLLHGDARLPRDWGAAVQRALARPPAAWYFDLAVEGGGLPLRLLEGAVGLRCRLRRLPYGDQGLLLPRALLQRAGGIRPLPLMEDLDLVQRLRPHAPLRSLGVPLRVDGRRWRRHGARLGVLRVAWRNGQLRRAWRRGVDAQELAARYYGTRR
ncbi:MAG: TIGR04283 family arsenosugar biosynthesis glycosyltransferase [Cyanobacteria bacterium REEB498]|nr:TIGR04283 family arsenosugar biosynthesis glycosyltransferase [Cyanobacteria bacterium REEB498]